MGKKAKEKRNSSEKIAQGTQNVPKPPQNDLYSQIFADTTDDEELIVEDERSTERPVPKNGKNKKVVSQAILEPQDKKPKATAILKGSKKSSSNRTPSSEKVDRNLKQVESDSDESEADEVMYDDDEDDDDEEQDDMNVDEEGDEGNELELKKELEEEQSDSEEESEDDNEDDKKTPLISQLKDLSFIELEALKQKMGLKEYNEAMFGKKTGKKTKFERKNKNRPLEISSKRRVPKLREVVKVQKKVQKDPRFDNACGEYSEQFWNTEYSFLRDLQKTEAEHMKKNLKSVSDNDKKREIRKFIQKVSDKEKSIAAKEKEAQKRLPDKEENKKRVEEGKRPFYVKKSTKKFMDLVEKYDELKSFGGLDKYLKKKRKKNAVRDRKSLKPFK